MSGNQGRLCQPRDVHAGTGRVGLPAQLCQLLSLLLAVYLRKRERKQKCNSWILSQDPRKDRGFSSKEWTVRVRKIWTVPHPPPSVLYRRQVSLQADAGDTDPRHGRDPAPDWGPAQEGAPERAPAPKRGPAPERGPVREGAPALEDITPDRELEGAVVDVLHQVRA